MKEPEVLKPEGLEGETGAVSQPDFLPAQVWSRQQAIIELFTLSGSSRTARVALPL